MTCQNPARQAQSANKCPNYSDKLRANSNTAYGACFPLPIPSEMATISVTTKTVVIADDTAFVRDRFRTAIENAGHKAVAVKSAAELLARIRADLTQID